MVGGDYILGSDGLPARKSGDWVKRKHHYFRNYCGITATGMKRKWLKRIFIDVMAGPGICKIEETGEEVPGLPFIALDFDFTKFFFIEGDADGASALKKRVQKHPKRAIAEVIHGDWTRIVATGKLDFDSALVVAFVDPTGISQVPWKALSRLLVKNQTIDLLITLQYAMGITLNADNYVESDPSSRTALDQFLGERNWRKWGELTPSQFKDRVLEQFENNIRSLGFEHGGQLTVQAQNRPLYRLALFGRHPKAGEFWEKIIKMDEKGQRELL
jgi:three-Cys-motif partner protein